MKALPAAFGVMLTLVVDTGSRTCFTNATSTESIVPTFSKQVIGSLLWQGGAQTAGQAVSWFVTISVIRLLAPADYGLMAMANVFLGFVFLFSDLGFATAVVQAPTLERDQLRRIFGIVIAMSLGAWAVIAGTAPIIAAFFHEPRLTALIRVLSLNFLLQGAYMLPQARVLRDMDFRLRARIDILATVLMAGSSLTLALLGFGVWSLAAGTLVMNGSKAVFFNIARPLRMTPAFSWRAVRPLAQFSLLVTVDRLLFYVYGHTDLLAGGRMLGKQALGLYAVALSLAVIPMEKLLPVITQVAFSAFSRIQSDGERVRRNLLRAVQLVSLICFPAFFGMLAVAGDLVPVVLGEKWRPLVVPLQLLCLTLPLKSLAAIFSPVLFGVGRPDVSVGNKFIALVIMSVAIAIGVRFGVIGICMAWVTAYPLSFLITTSRALRVLSTKYRDFALQLAWPAGLSVAMMTILFGIRETLGGTGPSLARLVVLIAVGSVFYAASVFTLQRDAVRDLLAVVRS